MPTISQALRDELRAGLTCHYCFAKATTWDHVVPRVKHGTNWPVNLTPACYPCNQAKGGDLPTCRCYRCRWALWKRTKMNWQLAS